jgi:hypothetical protein
VGSHLEFKSTGKDRHIGPFGTELEYRYYKISLASSPVASNLAFVKECHFISTVHIDNISQFHNLNPPEDGSTGAETYVGDIEQYLIIFVKKL